MNTNHEPKTETLAEFVARFGITAGAKRTTHNPNMSDAWAETARHWSVTLKRGELGVNFSEERFYFSQGMAHTEPPTATDVLGCLISEALNLEGVTNFKEWAESLGLSDDSIKATKNYNASKRNTARLEAFLGKDYRAALNCEAW